MKQIKQKYEAREFGGFSDTRVRFYLMGFMIFGLLMAPLMGVILPTVIVLFYGAIAAVKINEFQENNPESILRHQQAMDRMYHGSANADYYQRRLSYYEKASKKSEVKKIDVQPKNVKLQIGQKLVLSKSI